MRRALILLAAAALLPASTCAQVPPLMERAVLPSTSALPTCACVVPHADGEHLIVGLADGSVVVFHDTAGGVFDRTVRLPGSGPVDAVLACHMPRSGGSGTEFVLLAVRGRELLSVSFDDMRVADRLALAAPAGRYRLAKAAAGPTNGVPSGLGGIDRAVVFDDDSAMRVTVETPSLALSVAAVVEGVPELAVTVLSDRVVAATHRRVTEFVADVTGVRPAVDERTGLADEPIRLVVGPSTGDDHTLELRITDPDSVWITRRVTFPHAFSAVTAIADTLLAVGGTMALTPSHDVGWVALVNPRGRVVAFSDHASPVTCMERVDDFVAVQGGDRNLSVYDMDLRLLWDHDSPVLDAVLLAGDFGGDEAEDLSVVGSREYRLEAAMVDSIRTYLDDPGFMAGARRVGDSYVLRRAFITFYVSNAGRLREILAEGGRGAADAFSSGDVMEARALATEARAAAAVLGRRDDVAALTQSIAGYVSLPKRRTALLLAAFVLAALGVWVAVDCLKGGTSVRISVVSSLLLFATGAVVWRILGGTGLNALVFLGGAAAMVCAARAQLRPGTVRRRVPGAAIEDLIRALMEFLHGAGEGVPSDGVVDAARKSVTKVAYLAQEMVDSLDDTERYAMLRKRLRSRGDDFLDTTYPRVAVVLSLAKRAGFVVHEAERMSRAADRMKAAVTTILSDPPPELPILKQQLVAIKEGRDQLATAADRAWAVVQTDPGCSLTRSIDRILREKLEELAEADVRVSRTRGVPAERDAIALWSFEFRFILENLVTNAIRAMRSSKERVLSIETATDGTMCSVWIGDTGVGMDETTAGKLFEAKNDERNGGFGMPNTRHRLQEHGGDIVLERTAPGEGTTFLLTIPHWTPNTGESDV